MSFHKNSCESIPDMDLSCRITTYDCVVRQEDKSPNQHLFALECSNTSLHQHPVCSVACSQPTLKINVQITLLFHSFLLRPKRMFKANRCVMTDSSIPVSASKILIMSIMPTAMCVPEGCQEREIIRPIWSEK